jgi:molybdopterin converting factor small subunit
MMRVTILYFAALAELTGVREEMVLLDGPVTLGEPLT